jgi:hypothetical protein
MNFQPLTSLEDIDHLNEQSLVESDYTVSVEARSPGNGRKTELFQPG